MPRRTKEEIVAYLKELAGTEYTFSTPYKGRHEMMTCTHNTCGYTWEVEAGAFMGNSHKKGSRCPKCFGNVKKTTKQFALEVHNMSNGEFELVGEYKNAHEKVCIKHLVCGTSRMVIPNSFLSNSKCSSCPFCNGGTALSHEFVAKRVHDETKGAYELASKYTGCHEKILIRHKKCGNMVETTLADIATHHSIPTCRVCFPMYKGEAIIGQYLSDRGISCIPQKRFKNLKYNGRCKTLSFDYYVPSKNALIEYQGIQHYKPVEFFGGDKRLEDQMKRDAVKNNYALSNGYNFIAIPYTCDNPEKIYKFLDNKLV